MLDERSTRALVYFSRIAASRLAGHVDVLIGSETDDNRYEHLVDISSWANEAVVYFDEWIKEIRR